MQINKALCLLVNLLVLSTPTLAHAESSVSAEASSGTTLKSLSEPWTLGSDACGGSGLVHYLPIQRIVGDRVLVAAGSTLYMLDDRQQVRWSFDARADINGFAYVPKSDTVYVIAMDLTYVAVDMKSGKQTWSLDAMGRATFADIQPYKDDKYIVVTDMGEYEEEYTKCMEMRLEGKKAVCLRKTPDVVELCQEHETVGRADFPPGAHLAVVGDHVWAISPGKDSVSIREIHFAQVQEGEQH